MNFSNHGLIVTDISFWQDDDSTPQKVDFAKMKEAGAVGVILRGGQNSWADEDFQDYKRAAKEAGLARGYYWFYDSRSEPGRQANLWRALIGDDLPELGLWSDLEESYHGSYAGERYWKQFVLAVDAFFPTVKVRGVYTANWWWSNQAVSDLQFWSKYPLWVAQYEASQADVILPRPWIGQQAIFWQFTAHGIGQRFGVESLNIDLNYFNGTKEEFTTYFNVTEPLPIPDTEATMPYYRLNTTAANIRTGPGTSYADKGDLRQGDVVEEIGRQAGWSKYKIAQHADGTWVQLANGDHLNGLHGEYWSTNAYFVQAAGLPNPSTPTPEPDPTPDPQPAPDEITANINVEVELTQNGEVYKGAVSHEGLRLQKVG